jgi:hypothetical protein
MDGEKEGRRWSPKNGILPKLLQVKRDEAPVGDSSEREAAEE